MPIRFRAWCILAGLLLLPHTLSGGDRWNKKAFEKGTEAPDFTLPRMEIKTDAEGQRSGSLSKETVTLSSHRNKQTVILFFSSYT